MLTRLLVPLLAQMLFLVKTIASLGGDFDWDAILNNAGDMNLLGAQDGAPGPSLDLGLYGDGDMPLGDGIGQSFAPLAFPEVSNPALEQMLFSPSADSFPPDFFLPAGFDSSAIGASMDLCIDPTVLQLPSNGNSFSADNVFDFASGEPLDGRCPSPLLIL